MEVDSPGPYKIVLAAFEYFLINRDQVEIDLTGLIRICIENDCPDQEMAKGVIANMVEFGLLEFRKDETGQPIFSIKVLDDNQINLI